MSKIDKEVLSSCLIAVAMMFICFFGGVFFRGCLLEKESRYISIIYSKDADFRKSDIFRVDKEGYTTDILKQDGVNPPKWIQIR